MGMLPAEFFTAEAGKFILLCIFFATFLVAAWHAGQGDSREVRESMRQQKLIALHAYAARLQARARNGGAQ